MHKNFLKSKKASEQTMFIRAGLLRSCDRFRPPKFGPPPGGAGNVDYNTPQTG